MPTLLQTNLPAIMQAVETQLLTFTTVNAGFVAGDISNIYWVFRGQQPAPGTTGQRDILLIQREDTMTNVQGSGRFSETYGGLDVNLRSSYTVDPAFTNKQWMIRQAALIDGVRDALLDFFPVDADNNAYTIEGFVLDTTAEPDKQRDTETWGETICTFRFHYTPRIATSNLG